MKESGGEQGGPTAAPAPSLLSSSAAAAAAAQSTTGKRPYVRKQAVGLRNNKSLAHRSNHDPHREMFVYNNHQHQPDPSTHSNFCQSMLRISTMHMLQSAGYDAVQKNPIAVLSDCLGRYLEFLAEAAKEFAEHSGRSQITAFDVADGLSELGIDLVDLKEWFIENGGAPVSTNGDDNQATSSSAATGATAAVVANRPVLPTWKGADPGRVLQDITRKGREGEYLDIYEWRPLPEGFLMPETDEEQDAYAYPEGSDDDEHNSIEPTPLTAQSLQENRSRFSRWIPDTRPSHIPDFAPPFPNCALPADLTRIDSDDQMNGSVVSQSTDQYDTNASTSAVSTAGLDSAAVSSRMMDVNSAHAELSKLSINTTLPADADKDAVVPTATDAEIDQADVNPYTSVASFQESTQPFSTLYSTIPSKSKQPHGSQSTAPSSSTSLPQKSHQLFSDTLLTLLDPTPYPPTFAKRLKQQATLAHAIERAGEPSDTLFSNPQQSGMIDSLLKHSAPTVIVNKFANPGVSVQDALSPIVPSERIMNGGAQDYFVAQDQFTTGRTTVMPAAARKSSFSSSPLSTVSYPPKGVVPPTPLLTFSSNGPMTNLSEVQPKPKAGSRKSSLTSSEPTVPAAIPLQRTPSVAVAPPAPVAAPAGSGYSAAPINPTILSRIGSNFDPAALLATSGSGKAGANANGVSSPRTPALASAAPAYIPPPVSSSVFSSSSVVPGSSAAPISSPNQTSTKASATTTASTKPSAASTPKHTPTSFSKQQPAPPAPVRVPKPIPGPISLSDLPLSIPSSSTSVHVKPPATTTPTTPSAPKIRFKFSALDAISTGDQDTTAASSSKRDHGHHSSSSSSHHHRSSSLTSTGSSHHKKSKRSSRDYDEEEEEDADDGYSREKKKKKKSKSKDRDRDRDRDRERDRSRDRDRDRDRERDRERDRDRDGDRHNESSSRHKHHKQHKHSSHKSSSSNGAHGGSSSAATAAAIAAAQAPVSSAYGYYSVVPGGGAVDDSGEVINCICPNPTLDDGLFMIACDRCEVWFHGRCVGVREGDAVKTWFCQRCTSSGRA
ncbi:hypothetical protein BGW39_010526 [Mortierella sp. 14UC]|nr:hypothetical protein BGW39_010526 [Mortierella sp. 14UC]